MNSKNEEPLWTASEIAHYLNLSKSSVQGRVICRPDFPRAIKLPSGGRRWVPAEVRDWALKQREAA